MGLLFKAGDLVHVDGGREVYKVEGFSDGLYTVVVPFTNKEERVEEGALTAVKPVASSTSTTPRKKGR